MSKWNAIRILCLATLFVPAFGQGADPGRPGTLNYIEGQASIEGHALSHRSVGHAELQAGRYLATANGKAEVLLTPGIFLRLGENSTVKMVSPDLTHTEVQLMQGRASVEVDQLFKQNTILIDMKDSQTQLVKNGLYAFDANNNTVQTFDGKALVFTSLTPQANEKPIEVKGGRQLTLAGEALIKPVKFDKGRAESSDTLYKWSSLRSAYLGQSNLELASSYAGASGFAPGWFWNSSLYGYTWLPGDGLFWSPFGYGFYSPYYLYGGGFVYRGGRAFHGYAGYHGGAGASRAYRGSAAGGGGGFRGGGGGGASRGGGGGGHR